MKTKIRYIPFLFLFYTMAFAAPQKPNILWIFVEDLSPNFGAYGDPYNKGYTPVIDALAKDGVLFERAIATSPVCSPVRSGIITGAMQTTIGVHQHRSSRTTDGEVVPEALRIHLPEGVRTIPELMREAGYFTFNAGKDDYNFHYDRRQLYDVGTHEDYEVGQNGWQGNMGKGRIIRNMSPEFDYVWNDRPDKSQPWFGQIELAGGKARDRFVREGQKLAPYDVPMPPYYPETRPFRALWTGHHNSARGTDARVEAIIEQLKEDGEYENTLIFFFADHGNPTCLRSKQFPYDNGLHVPLIISGHHERIRPGTRRGEVVSSLDISATTLALGEAEMPDYLDGQDLFGDHYKAVDFVISGRDRCDFTTDRIRSVTSQGYSYIRNFFPERPHLQLQYRSSWSLVEELHRMHEDGELTDYQSSVWFDERPEEELYDLDADPYQLNNLAGDPKYKDLLLEKRQILETWIKETDDQGQYAEDPRQLKATYELWKDHSTLQGQQLNPEYDQFID